MQLTELVSAVMGYKAANDEKGMANFTKANFEEIKELYNHMMDHITRAGIENVKTYLTETDFYTTPASTKYHCAFQGA